MNELESEAKIKKTSHFREKLQVFGDFLSGMVLPNIGAFIAWGLLTALVIPSGWLPNEQLATIIDPAIKYLLPLLLAHTGGKMVAGERGAVIGAIGAIGLIVGSDIPMFLGAMIMGPLGGWVIKWFDERMENKIPEGFELVIQNFSLGILGFILIVLSYYLIGPVIVLINNLMTMGITALVSTGLLPLLAVINEPAKVLFLNNVIDQGIYFPLGMQETLDVGKSLYFTVASNPGPGLGLLLAFTFFGDKVSRKTAPGAIIIHFFGGIHELYFPYVYTKPLTIIGMIAGGMTGIFTFSLLDAGLVAGPLPGSIFSFLALTPRGGFLGILLGITASALVSFLVTALLLKARNKKI